ncbi:MAG: OmpA family protein [Muribaculaceae bacterium]|nr:OmpA family protein [Muribaculaceae bacterium]
MKKITILAFLCALFVAPSVNAQEVTTKEDPSQGYLLNEFKDNWFISVEAGGNLLLTPKDTKEDLLKRIQPSFEIHIGKWFSPVVGLRGGIFGTRTKGATANPLLTDGTGCDANYPHQLAFNVGVSGDALLNLTNWWCGYKADRLYNGSLYAGLHVNIPASKDGSVDFDIQDGSYLGFRLGLLNSFAVSKKVDLLVDLRFSANQMNIEKQNFSYKTDLLIGAAYKFGKSGWSAPIVPVCPTYKYTDAEGDALVARLQQADAKIASLEQQLRDCLNSKQTAVVEEAPAAPIATVYFPIGSASVNSVQAKVVKAVANAMKNTEEKYVLTGWADNYTGTAAFNKKLRAKRAASVKKMIVRTGVAADRLETTTNDNNLTEYGEKSASLDRAVTITVAE